MRRSLKTSSRLIFFVLLAGHLLAAADLPVHVPNVGKVNDHLYRGGEPSSDGLKELAGLHVVLDVDLREAGVATESERRAAEALGIKYVNVPFPPLAAPKQDEVKRVLSLISQDDGETIFVHCRRGKDRTGTIIACYRIQHDGWNSSAATEEARRYGMSWAERGMRNFILHFKPLDLGTPLPPEK